MLVDIPKPLPGKDDLPKYLLDVVSILHCYNNTYLRILLTYLYYFILQTAPQLPECIRGAFIKAVTTDTLRSMPNNRLHPKACNKPGVLLLGDAFNMRHPLTGGKL